MTSVKSSAVFWSGLLKLGKKMSFERMMARDGEEFQTLLVGLNTGIAPTTVCLNKCLFIVHRVLYPGGLVLGKI